MKKALLLLLMAAVVVSGAFAAVNFSGNFVTGYVFQNAHDEWTNYVFGQDNTDTNQTKLTLGIADEDGYWSIGLEGELYLDGANLNESVTGNRVAGDVTVDIAKMIGGADTDWSAKLSLAANDRITALRAYTNKSGLNYDRIRTDEEGLWTNLVLGYGDLIQVQVGGSPALTGSADDLDSAAVPGFQDGDFIASVMTKPIDGLAVSVDWAYVGDKASSLKDNYGVVGGAADVNIGALCGLDFDLGVGVADKYYYGTEKNVLSAQVYGGVAAFSIFGEYVLDDDISRVHFGADITAIENVLLNVYGGLGDISEAADSFYVGGNIGYEVCGITFALNLQYASYADGGHSYLHGDGGDKGGDIAQGGVKADGFSITPKISINF